MVVSDINLICVAQKEKSVLHIPGVSVLYFDFNKSNATPVYNDRYKLLKRIRGRWYQLYSLKRDMYDYSDELLDLYIYNTEKRIVFLKESFKPELINAIDKLICLSSKNTVLFFADLQGYRTCLKNISFDDFVECLYNGNLLFNTVYIICK